MMEKDSLKKYLHQYREEFDDEQISSEVYSRIVTGMDKRKEAAKRGLYFSMAACLTGVLIISSYLFFSHKMGGEVNNPVTLQASTSINVSPQIRLEAPLPKVENLVPVVTKKRLIKVKEDFHAAIFKDLKDSLSVAKRIEGVLKISEMKSPDNNLKAALCNRFKNDENSNVRLAALNVLQKFSRDSIVQNYLVNGLSNENDPVIQMELVKALGQNANTEITNKLKELAENPFTLNEIRDQVYYALLSR